jgi:hypothetical protein
MGGDDTTVEDWSERLNVGTPHVGTSRDENAGRTKRGNV